MASQAYDTLNKAWNSTCRVLFGQETAPLSDCAEWLGEYDDVLRIEKSSISGKPVAFSMNEYAARARFIGFDEAEHGKKIAQLGINEMKDIESVVSAVSERAAYVGNIVLGNSSNVQNSSNVSDSHYVIDSTSVADSKYVGYSRYVKESEYCFGILGAERITHVAKSMGSELKRCFECHMVQVLSDCYYCAKTQNCRECMFCFGMENGAYAIGNTQLPKEKYLQMKNKLLPEIAEKIRKDGRVLSLLELVERSGKHKPDSRLRIEKEPAASFDSAPVEKAFRSTSSLLFGKEIGGMESCALFLNKHVPQNVIYPSPLSGNESVACGYRAHVLKKFDLHKRLVTEEEMRSIGKAEGLAKLDGLRIDLDFLVDCLHPVAYTNLDKVAGNCSNFRHCAVIIDSLDCCEGSAFDWSKKCAHCFWTSRSEAIFGSCVAWDSSYCMKTFYSKKMTRAFEVDGCQACADIYYSHNCENVRDSMFCFNAKNLNNAVGNAPLPAEQYKKVKGTLVSQMADELGRTKNLKWDIFNIWAAKR